MPDELLTARLPDELRSLLDVPFRFRRRPIPIPPDRRVAYRLPLLLLLLRDCSRKNKSTLKRVHFLDWAVRSQRRAEAVKTMTRLSDLGTTVIRYDPMVDAALRLAAAEKLINVDDGRITLTDRGLQYLNAVDSDGDLLKAEKIAIQTLGKHVPESWF